MVVAGMNRTYSGFFESLPKQIIVRRRPFKDKTLIALVLMDVITFYGM